MKMYAELARWWPLLSPPSEYVEEAAFFAGLLAEACPDARTLLELGCGGGSLAWHLKGRWTLTLVDRSREMLAVCRAANPECQLVEGDMRHVRMGRQFDAVLVHDAIMYAETEVELAATIATAATHCAAGGVVILAPDYTKETFAAESDHGGADGYGCSLRYLEWTWDPDPGDDTFESAYDFYLREGDGPTHFESDRHREGLFAQATWLRLMDEAGLDARAVADPWRETIFLGRKR